MVFIAGFLRREMASKLRNCPAARAGASSVPEAFGLEHL
jgi:hypothetical protein